MAFEFKPTNFQGLPFRPSDIQGSAQAQRLQGFTPSLVPSITSAAQTFLPQQRFLEAQGRLELERQKIQQDVLSEQTRQADRALNIEIANTALTAGKLGFDPNVRAGVKGAFTGARNLIGGLGNRFARTPTVVSGSAGLGTGGGTFTGATGSELIPANIDARGFGSNIPSIPIEGFPSPNLGEFAGAPPVSFPTAPISDIPQPSRTGEFFGIGEKGLGTAGRVAGTALRTIGAFGAGQAAGEAVGRATGTSRQVGGALAGLGLGGLASGEFGVGEALGLGATIGGAFATGGLSLLVPALFGAAGGAGAGKAISSEFKRFRKKACIIITVCTDENSPEVDVTRRYRDRFMDAESIRGYYMMAEDIVPALYEDNRLRIMMKETLVNRLIDYGEVQLGDKDKLEYNDSENVATRFLKECKELGQTVESFTRSNGEVV